MASTTLIKVACAASVAGAVALAILQSRRRMRKPKTCTLRWGHACERSFCRESIQLDLGTFKSPDAELVAAIFGSAPASAITVTHVDGSVVQPMGESKALALVAGEEYVVSLATSALASLSKVVPIESITESIGSEAAIAALSRAFYRRVFADEDDAAFRALFAGSAGTAEAAAESQWRWLVEMWGGAPRYSQQHGNGALLTRMLSKHGPNRMTYRFCARWLEHMLAAMDEVCMGGHPAIGESESIARYWLHFFGFFPLSADERRKLRMLALGPLPRTRRRG